MPLAVGAVVLRLVPKGPRIVRPLSVPKTEEGRTLDEWGSGLPTQGFSVEGHRRIPKEENGRGSFPNRPPPTANLFPTLLTELPGSPIGPVLVSDGVSPHHQYLPGGPDGQIQVRF